MSPILTIRQAYRNIRDNRLRSSLTVLGLVIGIASVIILVGIGNGAAGSVRSQVASLGADIITVSITDSESGLTTEQTEALEELENVEYASPYEMLSAGISKDGESSEKSTVIATGAEYVSIMGYDIASGRDLSRIDVDNYSKVAVIGSSIAETYWGTSDPVGDTIAIDGDSYTVVGVLEETGSSMGSNVDEMLLVPNTTAKYLGSTGTATSIYIKSTDEDLADETASSIERYLGQYCGINEDYYDVSTQAMMLDAMEDINNTLALLLGGIAGISLLVGGIGVMNVMLVSVTERTKEIGIRKSLGAKRKDILYQFLVESLVLSMLGGAIGVICGFIGGRIAVLFGASFLPGIKTVLLAFAVSVAVGLIFGILPANRASKLKPVEALRFE